MGLSITHLKQTRLHLPLATKIQIKTQSRLKAKTIAKMIRLLSLNCFLIPNFIAKHQNNPLQRSKLISNFISEKQPNIVALQEEWGVGLNNFKLNNYLTSQTSINLPSCNSIDYVTLIDWLKLWLKGTGGLLSLCREPIQLVWEKQFIYPTSATLSRKGISATLFDITQSIHPFTQSIQQSTPSIHQIHQSTRSEQTTKENDQLAKEQQQAKQAPDQETKEQKYLLLVNTHLDAFNDNNKLTQLNFLKNYIKQLTLNLPSKHVAIVLTGDFNIAAPLKNGEIRKDCASGNGLYQKLIHLFDSPLIDFYKQVHGDKESVTYDPENVLSYSPGNFGRIDYFLGVCEIDGVEYMQLKCTKFEIEQSTIMSDHYPILAEFEIK